MQLFVVILLIIKPNDFEGIKLFNYVLWTILPIDLTPDFVCALFVLLFSSPTEAAPFLMPPTLPLIFYPPSLCPFCTPYSFALHSFSLVVVRLKPNLLHCHYLISCTPSSSKFSWYPDLVPLSTFLSLFLPQYCLSLAYSQLSQSIVDLA